MGVPIWSCLTGAEAMSTVAHFAKSNEKPNFGDDPEDPDGVYEDRGFGLKGLITMEQVSHGLVNAPVQYALLENARRAARGQSRSEYSRAMGDLFAPFTKVAAGNPFSAAPELRDSSELTTVTERNRIICEPYTRYLVARDYVNQAAAVLLTSVQTAQLLGIDRRNGSILHGQADLARTESVRAPAVRAGAVGSDGGASCT